MTAVFFEDSDEVFYNECDNCNNATGGLVVWKEKDFAICFKCLGAIANKHLGTQHPIDGGVIVSRRTISEKLRSELLAKFNHSCVICGSTHRLQIDHIVPWSLGGLTEKENLQVLCQSCNLKKGNTR